MIETMAILINWKHLGHFFLLLSLLFFFCEFLIYYLVLLQCSWPVLVRKSEDVTVPNTVQHKPLRVMILADTHLLGSRQGHWFDKLRREWQMERAYQTALSLHGPDIVFVLGDLTDEGLWSNDAEFKYHVDRFYRMFHHSDRTQLHVVVGNHDIGFHYGINEYLLNRFEKAFNAPSVRMLNIAGNVFILLNSMSMEGDDCFMCGPAMMELKRISNILNCSQETLRSAEDYKMCKNVEKLPFYSRPILLQHFPMYRKSDALCKEPDSAPPEEKNEPFREKWECLSKQASNLIFQWLHPRLIMTGHTHHGCYLQHPDGTPEWTIASFSSRNKKSPSFLLATISPSNFAITKCFMPREGTVIICYGLGLLALSVWLALTRGRLCKITRYTKDR